MTNQIDSTSPFGNSAGSTEKTPSAPENFSIRTMKDDLLSLQNGTAPVASSSVPIEKISEEKPFDRLRPMQQEQETPASNFSQTTSPFMREGLPQERPAVATQKTPVPEEMYYSEKPAASVDMVYKITLGVIILLAVAIIGLGGYYFLVVKKQNQAAPVVSPVVSEEPTTEVMEEEKPPAPVAPVKQNPAYLSLDTASLSADAIKTAIISKTKETEISGANNLAEFIIVDTNNNPVSFPIFAQATKINLPATLLNDLSEKFSLFIYKDKDAIRLALAVTAKEKNELPSKMLAQEKTLAKDLEFLFLDLKPTLTENVFKSGAYKEASVRFLNFSSPANTSIDYSLFKNTLLVGTSQFSLRAVIDKLSSSTQFTKNDGTTSSSAENCASLADNLSSCETFKCTFIHPLSGERLQKEIVGLVNDKCKYIEQMPNNGKMECNYTADLRVAVAQYYKGLASADSMGTSVSSAKTEYTINGKIVSNPLQEATDTAQCVISGY